MDSHKCGRPNANGRIVSSKRAKRSWVRHRPTVCFRGRRRPRCQRNRGQKLTSSSVRLSAFSARSLHSRSSSFTVLLAASGGAVATIKIYDLSSSAEIVTLLDHTGVVAALAFYVSPLTRSLTRNLISASDNGSVYIYDVDPFIHLKTVMAHRHGINDLPVHSPGQLALTMGRDSFLSIDRLWQRGGRRWRWGLIGWR